jgi:hypothetical protein
MKRVHRKFMKGKAMDKGSGAEEIPWAKRRRGKERPNGSVKIASGQ